MACPVSTITDKTWRIIRLVQRCTGGEYGDLQHLPFPGTLLQQPDWFLEAIDIMKAERGAYRQRMLEKGRTRKGT